MYTLGNSNTFKTKTMNPKTINEKIDMNGYIEFENKRMMPETR